MESKTSVENFKTYPTVGRLTQADLQRYRRSQKRKTEKAASKAESVKTEKAAQKVEPVKIENVTQRDKAVKTSPSKDVSNSQTEKKSADTTSQSTTTGQNEKNNASMQSGSTTNTKRHPIAHIIVLCLVIISITLSIVIVPNDLKSGKYSIVFEILEILQAIFLCIIFPVVVYGLKSAIAGFFAFIVAAIDAYLICHCTPWSDYLDTHNAFSVLVFFLCFFMAVFCSWCANVVVESLQRKASEKGKK